jgi:hypothetical protein
MQFLCKFGNAQTISGIKSNRTIYLARITKIPRPVFFSMIKILSNVQDTTIANIMQSGNLDC